MNSISFLLLVPVLKDRAIPFDGDSRFQILWFEFNANRIPLFPFGSRIQERASHLRLPWAPE